MEHRQQEVNRVSRSDRGGVEVEAVEAVSRADRNLSDRNTPTPSAGSHKQLTVTTTTTTGVARRGKAMSFCSGTGAVWGDD